MAFGSFSVSSAKIVSSLLPDRGNEVIRELFRCDIRNVQDRRELKRPVTNGVQQMSLAQTHTAIDEKRVELSPRVFRHGDRRRMRKSVRGSDDIRAKHVLWVEPVTARRRERHLSWPVGRHR